MTRETKIGLLVGLAFIIVIGILLSDHINSASDPMRADPTETVRAIDQSVATPDARNQGSMTVVAPPAPIIPQNRVATTVDPLPPGNPPSTIVEVTPGGDPSQLRLLPRPAPQPTGGVEVLPPSGPIEVATNDGHNASGRIPEAGVSNPAVPTGNNPLERLVSEHSNELAMPGGSPVGFHNAPAPAAGNGSLRQVKAEEGDTVTKLAVKYLGGNSKANRAAIIAANPSMTPDGHLVIAGRNYLIPGASTGPVANAQTNQPAPRPTPTPAPAPAPAPAPTVNYYTVKENDSLWKIASEQLGSGARYTEIRDLNPDVLKGSENVHIGMRLKLPAKAVASTN
ncbi:MAG TPA: LysM peptidoglycan-binding domain-containing protein [Tepidisphaeraceae bacterium]|nr:LysM peptidoglycan-binding domain-containing protein [Tepidisphaeraceae bacterium]